MLKCNFTGFANDSIFAVVYGKVSKWLYYMYELYTPLPLALNAVIRKINQDGSLAWMTALPFDPIVKALSVDDSEQYVYLAGSMTNIINVARLIASNGSIESAQTQ